MLKLRFSKPFLSVYNEGKVTVCRYYCTLIEGDTKEIKDEFRVTGTAKCSPNDTLNPEFGRKLADSRAKLAAYKIASKVISPECMPCLIDKVNKELDLIEFVDTMNYLKKKELEHIKVIEEEEMDK